MQVRIDGLVGAWGPEIPNRTAWRTILTGLCPCAAVDRAPNVFVGIGRLRVVQNEHTQT